ncbi:MAG: PDZ domain-containing protein, partial [Clostridiales bacterium]|nr:PDZ domain-containing protein [Clostridiales bacterium]
MDFIRLLFSTFLQSFTNVFFVFLVLIVYWNLKGGYHLEESWLGFNRYKISNQLLEQILYGMLSGLFASFIIVLLGITIDYKAILMIWPIAVFLMLFNQRYMCFSYAAGIISIISLLFNWPKIDVSAIIALVGILHLMESGLIFFSGHRSSLPVYVEKDRFKPAGAYVMQKMWPIPLVVLVVPDVAQQLSTAGGVDMPQWWPIFQSQGAATGMLIIFPIVAILGYADIAITQTPRGRARQSGLWLGLYSILILLLAVISSRIYWIKYLAAIS